MPNVSAGLEEEGKAGLHAEEPSPCLILPLRPAHAPASKPRTAYHAAVGVSGRDMSVLCTKGN